MWRRDRGWARVGVAGRQVGEVSMSRLVGLQCCQPSCSYLQLIVAVEDEEVPRLMELWRRGQANGVQGLRLLEGDQIREIEPHCRVSEGADGGV